MTTSPHIANSKLTEALVPAPDADFAEVIFPFAMTFDAYQVWGDAEARAVAQRVWTIHEQTGALSASLTKLRTSLFVAARQMRMTDFDEDLFGIPGSEADWIKQMRDHVAAIRSQAKHGPKAHLSMMQATTAAMQQVMRASDPHESDLRAALARALADVLNEPIASSATGHEHTFTELPLWAEHHAPGPFDLIVGETTAPSLAAEVKLAPKNTLSHSLWDILKLLGVLALSAEQVYLIAAYPSRVWNKAEFARLYEPGRVEYTKLPIAKEWPSLLRHGHGVPSRIPNAIEVTEIARLTATHAGEPWQLKTVAIDPTVGGWLDLSDGRLEAPHSVGNDE